MATTPSVPMTFLLGPAISSDLVAVTGTVVPGMMPGSYKVVLLIRLMSMFSLRTKLWVNSPILVLNPRMFADRILSFENTSMLGAMLMELRLSVGYGSWDGVMDLGGSGRSAGVGPMWLVPVAVGQVDRWVVVHRILRVVWY